MIEGLEFKTISDHYPCYYAFVNKYGDHAITVAESPFHNCQTYTIGSTNDILMMGKEKALKIFQYINDVIEKNQMLVDVNKEYLPNLKEIFNIDDFIFIQEYENFTGSQMVMCLINVRGVLGGCPDDDDDDDWDDDDDY